MNTIGGRLRILMLGGLLGFLSMGARQAHAIPADPCGLLGNNYVVANGDSCTVDLTQSNVDFFDNHILVRLLLTNPVSGNSTIQLVLESKPFGLTLLGFDRFGLNATLLASALPSGWGICPGNGNISSFGVFSACAKDNAGADSSPIFTLNGDIGSFAMNNAGTHFVSHMRFGTRPDSSCSAFAGDTNVATNALGAGECLGASNNPPSPPQFIPTPEPSSFLLLGSGLIAFAASIKRKAWQG
jgi:hypothetical protein